MEVVLLAAGLNTLLPRLWEKRKDERKERYTIDVNMEAIERHINRLQSALEDAKFSGDGTGSALKLKQEARKLSQETRDCIQRFFKDKKASCRKFAMKTEAYSKAIEKLCDRVEGHSPRDKKASVKPPDPYVADPMGMTEPVEELLELLKVPGRPSKVISIVGFPGLGKTLLAKLVYDRTDCTLRARVTAAAKGANQVLTEILKQVGIQDDDDDDNFSLEKLGQRLEQVLRGKRYLIVIDDIQSMGQWNGMRDAFPKDLDDNGNGDGTIIVTTTIQSVADVCSSCNGYVYKLSPLDEDKSLDLFLKDRSSWDRYLTKENASDMLEICEGLPLAIVSISQFLKGRGVPTSGECKDAFKQVGVYLLEGGRDLERLRWVLMNKYTGLTSEALRSCLLYFCMYKHKMYAVPRMNSLIRRWEAEGFLVAKYGSNRPRDVAAENLKTLVDRSIVQSMEVSANGRTRRCRPPGMMVEYISQISKSENFAALVSDVVPSGIRRLSFHPGSVTDDKKNSGRDLSLVLTLAVSGNGCNAILDFKKYELVAVLDLKQCTNLKDSHVKDICRLLLLKYLSLGVTIGKIPRDIGGLVLLETLEMRTTETVMVYEEILKLPNLRHLHGMFKLKKNPDRKLEEFLSKSSEIETITGFVTENVQGFPQLMRKMKRLRKVKIVCAPNAVDEDMEILQTAIKEFVREGTNMADHRFSLSVDFAECTDAPLEFLQYSGSVTSLKLRGNLGLSLGSQQFTQISGINKLCLSRTCLSAEAVLAGLTNLDALEYLKLEGDQLEPIVIRSGNFVRLVRLSLVSKQRVQFMEIESGALPRLVSFHLICKDLGGGLQNSIRGLELLKEIALDYEVHTGIKEAWKGAARCHTNRPDVLLIQNDTPIRKA